MQNILKSIELKNELDALRPLNKDQEDEIMQKFRLDWNYHSNHLEGNSLTFGETKNLILHGITAQGKPLKDHFEITGHNEALNLVIDIVKDERPITENFIRELHELLLKEPYYVDAITPDGAPTKKLIQVGKYKTSPNHVKTTTGEIFRFAEPEETPAKMYDLLEWYRNKKAEKDVNSIILAAEFHYKFIIIHPFDDGNGRLARILMNFILMSFSYPPVIIKADTANKYEYFFALRQADNNDIEFFVDYIAKNLIRSLEIMIAGAKGESIEEPDDIDKQISLLEYKLKGIGGKSELYKKDEFVFILYDFSIKPILDKLISECEKLDKFYAKNYIEFIYNNKPNITDKRDVYSKLMNLIDNKMESLILGYNHIDFNNKYFEDFSYGTQIRFEFLNTKYKVKNKKKVFIKPYNEYLSSEEIDELINYEITLHTDYINKQIREFENKNTPKND